MREWNLGIINFAGMSGVETGKGSQCSTGLGCIWCNVNATYDDSMRYVRFGRTYCAHSMINRIDSSRTQNQGVAPELLVQVFF